RHVGRLPGCAYTLQIRGGGLVGGDDVERTIRHPTLEDLDRPLRDRGIGTHRGEGGGLGGHRRRRGRPLVAPAHRECEPEAEENAPNRRVVHASNPARAAVLPSRSQFRVKSSIPELSGWCGGAKNGKVSPRGTSLPFTLSPSGVWLATKKRIVSMTSSASRRPFGNPAPALLPPPGPEFATEGSTRRKSPFVTATLARMPMFVALVPSLVSVATMSSANRPLASSCVDAKLYSSLRANGISTVLIAGLPMRSTFTKVPRL